MASPSKNSVVVMERSSQDPLKCPRCSSSNTKFCYYNNYSLSQPRHFCKDCKRYWTRGGTLRNVPVGGGCRKNKKVKPQPSSGGAGGVGISSLAAASTATIKTTSSSQSGVDPLFYSLPTDHPEVNFPFSRLRTTRVSSDCTAFNHPQPRVNDPSPMFFGSSTSTMGSLLASSIQQQRFSATGFKDFQTSDDFSSLMAYEDMEMVVGNGEIGKESKMEGENTCRFEWSSNQNQIEQINLSSDSSSLLWNTNNIGGAWFDPSNLGSSVPSLI